MMKQVIRIGVAITLVIASYRAEAQTVPVWKLADLKRAVDSAKGPTVINFWATFCKPCIAELPHFQAVAEKYKKEGVKLLLVSLDMKEAYPKTIGAFLKKRKITAPVYFLNETDADLFIPAVDSTWSGVIPATLFIHHAKNYRSFTENELSRKSFEEEIRKML